jgi:cell fate regulator YaaT (PSP1 superfamily)
MSYAPNDCHKESYSERFTLDSNPQLIYPHITFYSPRESADGFVYQVRFKYASKYYLLAPSMTNGSLQKSQSQFIQNGDYVSVEADRGFDIGVVIAKTPLDGFKENRLTIGRSGVHTGDYKHVLRIATEEELRIFFLKQAEEERAVEVDPLVDFSYSVQVCRNKAFETGLQLRIIDAEFQFDRRKLNIYFEAKRFLISCEKNLTIL